MTPEEAYGLAYKLGPSDETRKIACQSSYWAYRYALEVDKCGRDDTRKAVCLDPGWVYWYAFRVDQGPRDNTRAAACQDPFWAYAYAQHIDRCLHPAVLQVILSIRLARSRELLEFD